MAVVAPLAVAVAVAVVVAPVAEAPVAPVAAQAAPVAPRERVEPRWAPEGLREWVAAARVDVAARADVAAREGPRVVAAAPWTPEPMDRACPIAQG